MMENEKKKCSCKKHSEQNAINYCPECDLYLCNKCTNNHSELLINHQVYNLSKNNDEIFTGKCNELNHKLNLQYFCETHNKLCCAACLSKIKEKGYGQHFDCKVYSIEKIKVEKKTNLNNNIKYLEEFSKTIEDSINKLKEILKTINEKKDELKKEISTIFTKIRSTLNDREDELLDEVDNLYEKTFLKEDIIKKGEKAPHQIEKFLIKGKLLNDGWNDDNKLITNINDCINIENNIKNIKEINESINKYNTQDNNILFLTEENYVKNILENIKKFGRVEKEEKIFKIKFKQTENYKVDDKGLNITKLKSNWGGLIQGEKEIPKNKITKWKIKINTDLNPSYDELYIGICKKNAQHYKEAWSVYSKCLSIYLCLEGNSLVYNNHKEKLKKGDIIEVIVDRIENKLSFAINNVNFGIACSNIPKDIELYPSILLYEENLNVEVI